MNVFKFQNRFIIGRRDGYDAATFYKYASRLEKHTIFAFKHLQFLFKKLFVTFIMAMFCTIT